MYRAPPTFLRAKIPKTRRPSLNSEVIALAEAIDYANWSRTILIEIYSGEFIIDRLAESDPLPLSSPFMKNPTDDKVRQDLDTGSSFATKENAICTSSCP